MAKKIKKKTNILVSTTGQLDDLIFADNALKKKQINLITIARKFLNDNKFIFKNKLFSKELLPPQYKRGF